MGKTNESSDVFSSSYQEKQSLLDSQSQLSKLYTDGSIQNGYRYNGSLSNSSSKLTDLHQTRPSSTTPNSSLSASMASAPSYDVINNDPSHIESSGSEEPAGRTSWIMASFLLINAALGAGLLNYPVAYDRLGGIVFASIIQVFAVFLMATTIMVLIYCAYINNESSYHGVMRTMCGKRVMQFAAASIAITCFGICVTFVIIIGDQFDRIFATYIGNNFCTYWYANRYFTMAITSIATIWPMCYFRRLDFLRHVNVLGVIASFYIIFLNVYTYYTMRANEQSPPPMRTRPQSGLEFVAALPIIFFSFQTHEVVIPVHSSMSDKSIGSFAKAIALALGVLLALYSLAGTYGYMTFGSNVAPDIMLMYDANDPVVVAGIAALVIKMVTTYPPVLFCGRDTIVRIIVSRFVSKANNHRQYQCLESVAAAATSSQRTSTYSPDPITKSNYERKFHILITTIWNISVLLLAIAIPNITVAIGFLGSLASCNVFLFPGLALVSLTLRYSRSRKQFSTVTYRQELERNERRSRFSLHRRSVQFFLIGYGLFIITMGVVMFFVILIQVYHDLQAEIPHGAVCNIHEAVHHT